MGSAEITVLQEFSPRINANAANLKNSNKQLAISDERGSGQWIVVSKQ
jgi:hypothetical protein